MSMFKSGSDFPSPYLVVSPERKMHFFWLVKKKGVNNNKNESD